MSEAASYRSLFSGSLGVQKLLKDLSSVEKAQVQPEGLTGSAFSFVFAQLFRQTRRSFLLVFDDKEEAAYHLNDLQSLAEGTEVLFYPASHRRPYEADKVNSANVLLRSEVLEYIGSNKKPPVIVTYPGALFEKVITEGQFKKNTLEIKSGDTLSPEFVNELLFEYGFERCDFVSEPGEFSLRGGILDVFSFSYEQPFRIEFFGDEVESIRTFDIETQLSEKEVKVMTIVPNIEDKQSSGERVGFLERLSENTVLFVKDSRVLTDSIGELFELSRSRHSGPEKVFCSKGEIVTELKKFTVHKAEFNTRPQPAFNKRFDLLIQDLNERAEQGYTNYIFCSGTQQARRFHDIFEEAEQHVSQYQTVETSLYQGFIDEGQKLACYTDHEIFERYHKFRLGDGYARKQAITLKELNNLAVGDYVTHIDHGIGRFAGLQKIEVNGKHQETIKLVYAERDVLHLSIHSLHKISRYNGEDGKPPKVYKLGSGAWKALKQKTRKKIKQIAYDLIALYARRKMKKGFSSAPDSYLQHELESSFIYEDTPDQLSATQVVKADMESEQPMDRLVCGDVGFGKTEVAIRAAFKAVDNGKQVAVLAPTTILAFQHYNTFSERLGQLPVTVNYLNRFRSAKQRREITKGLKEGRIDIAIGTHQLVGKNIKFKDLGLLIIDEEQKFGVAVKDKIKLLKENVDTLTLTATPIPRTLQFSLMAARDLSVIATPPPNRHPIETRVVRFSQDLIKEAIGYEISRGGQVFFVHNRIQNIAEVADLLQRLLPGAKIGIGHGRMKGEELEKLMLEFMKGQWDILVSTSIVENGLDVPNANTIFVNDAHNFGLSDLHQLRGRVGRSNKKAFCYFVTPDYLAMTDVARKRMKAIEQFSHLGSGFHIAMKDLEIRGAGDLLGAEQSGFISEMGFDTYQKILAETIDELKEKEFKSLYQKEEPSTAGRDKTWLRETSIDTDFELLFPDDYVNNVAERLNLYRELNEVADESGLSEFESGLEDRFGPLPPQAEALLTGIRVKWKALELGLERLVMKNGRMTGYFISDPASRFYQSKVFNRLLQYIQSNPMAASLREKETAAGKKRLVIIFGKVRDIDGALQALSF